MPNQGITFDDINRDNISLVEHTVPDKGIVFIYRLSFKERLDFDLAHTNEEGAMNIRSSEAMCDLISRCVYSSEHDKLFDTQDKVDKIPELDGAFIAYLFTLCVSENYISSASVEVLEKN